MQESLPLPFPNTTLQQRHHSLSKNQQPPELQQPETSHFLGLFSPYFSWIFPFKFEVRGENKRRRYGHHYLAIHQLLFPSPFQKKSNSLYSIIY
jgi:hypothetical protein